MALRDQIEQDLKAAMLAKDQPKVLALRNIKSAVKNKEIDGKKNLEDAEVIALLSTLKKQREESITQYKAGNREDLADKERAELAIIQHYLPQQLDAGAIDQLVADAIKATGATNQKDMGKVMKQLMPQTTGRADGKLVSERVKAALEKLG